MSQVYQDIKAFVIFFTIIAKKFYHQYQEFPILLLATFGGTGKQFIFAGSYLFGVVIFSIKFFKENLAGCETIRSNGNFRTASNILLKKATHMEKHSDLKFNCLILKLVSYLPYCTNSLMQVSVVVIFIIVRIYLEKFKNSIQ